MRSRPMVFVAVLVAAPGWAQAEGLQPLDAFIASAKEHNPDSLEAQATLEQARANADSARASYLPSLNVQGTYTRNQYASSFVLGDDTDVTIQKLNALQAVATVSIPLIDVKSWQEHKVAKANARTSEASRASTELGVEESVTRSYYDLLSTEAVLVAARERQTASKQNADVVADRRELGTASELDLQRALADVAQTDADVTSAEQDVVIARRSLESVSRLTPAAATRADYHEASLDEEAPLEHWMHTELVAVKPSILAVKAAQASEDAARYAWLPTLTAQAQEVVSDTAGLAGHASYYTLSVVASWTLDFAKPANTRAARSGVAIARAREDSARRAAEDQIFEAWQRVHLGIAKAKSARAQVKAARLAQELARDRYANGASTQLEVIDAQRDLFDAALTQVQADFDLTYARAALRLVSRGK